MKAQVFFTDMRARKAEEASVKKLRKLLDASGVLDVVEQGDLVAIKVHLGTPGNQRHIRPHHVRVVVEAVRERGGHPFVT
ncbi:4Fe-4S ferredoxin, partial [Candidatus Bathyarchaeota archaeon ex4484_135]